MFIVCNDASFRHGTYAVPDGLVVLDARDDGGLVITETKLDSTFPEKQFYVPGYKKPFRKDRNKNGGGVMIYVREDIPSDILMKHSIEENIEAIFVEINLRKNKLLLVGTYHSTNASIWLTYWKQTIDD